MKKIFAIILFFFILKSFCFGQQHLDESNFIDSLSRALQQARSDSVKCRLQFLLSDAWSYKDTIKAKYYLTQSQKTRKGKPLLNALYYYYEAGYYFDLNPERSKKTYMKVDSFLQTFKTPEAYSFRGNAWRNYASICQIHGNDKIFTTLIINKAIPLSRKANDLYLEALCYQNLGMTFTNIHQYDRGDGYFMQAIELFKKVSLNKVGLPTTYILSAQNYMYQNKLSPAKKYIDQCTAILKSFPPETLVFIDYYNAEALYFEKLKKYKEALTSIDKGIALAKKLNRAYEEHSLFFRKYKVYKAQKRYKEAKEILFELIRHKPTQAFVLNRTMHYFELAETYANTGNHAKAFEWMRRTALLNDSLLTARYKDQFNVLEARYRYNENQTKIAALQAEKKQNALSAKNNRLYNWVLGAACLLFISIAAFSFIYYRNYKKLSLQQEINYQQQVKELEQGQQLTATKAMLDGEDRERERVARDLHDGLGGMLAGVKMNLAGWAAGYTELQQNDDLYKVIGQLDYSVGELRRIARNMMPETLLKFGLETALKDLCEFYMREGIYIGFQPFNINSDISPNIQLHIYRISQELLANAIRHARAENIVLQCSQNDNVFLITAEDDGIGFDTKKLSGKNGIGLHNLKNRVEYLKGEMEIISAPGEGTTVNIEINTHAV